MGVSVPAAAGVKGTNLAVKGQLYAGTVGTPLANDVYFCLALGSAATVDATYLDVQLYCTQPAHSYVKLTAQTNSGSNLWAVDTDVTTEAPWSTTAGRNIVGICNVNKALDYQRTTLSAIAAAQLTTVDNADSNNITGTYMVLLSRNIEITISSTNYGVQNGSNAVLQCAIRQTGSQAGRGVYATTGFTVSGVVSGFTHGVSQPSPGTVTGVVVGCYYGVSGASGQTISGTVSGCFMGVYTGTGHTLSGTVSGCTYGIAYGSGHTLSGTVSGCTSGIAYGSGHTLSGTVSGCTYGIYQASAILNRGSAIGGAGGLANTQDVYMLGCILGEGAGLYSATQVANYKDASANGGWQQTVLYDVADSGATPQPGQVKAWMPGGTVASEAAPASPPVTLAFAHKHLCEVAAYPVFIDIPLWTENGVPVLIDIYIKSFQSPSGMTEGPRVQLIAPNYSFDHASSKLVDTAIADNTNLQTIAVNYTPTETGPLILRVRGRNASGYWHWMFKAHQLTYKPGLEWAIGG